MSSNVDVSKLKVPRIEKATSKNVAKGTTVTPDDVTRDTPVRGSSSPSIAPKNHSAGGVLVHETQGIAQQGREPLGVITDQTGKACFVIREGLHLRALPVESRQGQNIVRSEIMKRGGGANRNAIKEWTDDLLSAAEESAEQRPTYSRVAPCRGGVELDLGDEKRTRIRVVANKVEILDTESETLFYRLPNSLPLPYPAETGNLAALRDLLNVNDLDFKLLIAWVTYTLAHPKVEGSKYVFLVLSGDQGTGKSFISRLLLKMIDPSKMGIQALPSKSQDLAMVLQSAHVVAFDNMRGFKATTSDLLCMASTGGVLNDRKLYTDSDLSSKTLHGAVVFNGIHKFVAQSDLAQRCLTIRLTPLIHRSIRSEQELLTIFTEHHAEILRYLLEAISRVFHHLPDVTPCRPERMIDFCRWLAAFEKSEGLEDEVLQHAYSENLNQSQLDTLMENTLSASIIAFCERHGGGMWTGTPTEFYQELCSLVAQRTLYGRDWPNNPIALGKRLTGLKASLASQGINIDMSRGRQRNITVHIDGRIFPVAEENSDLY